jgi:hypothetical protein
MTTPQERMDQQVEIDVTDFMQHLADVAACNNGQAALASAVTARDIAAVRRTTSLLTFAAIFGLQTESMNAATCDDLQAAGGTLMRLAEALENPAMNWPE